MMLVSRVMGISVVVVVLAVDSKGIVVSDSKFTFLIDSSCSLVISLTKSFRL